MRRSLIGGLTFAALLAMNGCASSGAALTECFSTRQFTRMVAPAFSYYMMNVAASEKSRIDVYLQMPYKKIRFQKEGPLYNASYSYTFVIRDEKNEIVQSKDVDRSVAVGSYEESVSSRFDSFLQTFFVVPGTYMIEIRCRDNLSQLVYRMVHNLEAKNFRDPSVAASSVLLLDTVSRDGKGILLRPILPDNISSLSGSLGMFREVYNIRRGDTLTIRTRYTRVIEDTADVHTSYLMPPYRLKHESCYGDSIDEYFSSESTFVASTDAKVQLIQSYPLPPPGYSTVHIAIAIRSSIRSDTISSTLPLFRRDPMYKNSPSYHEIIAGMRYITREEEFDSLQCADAEEQMQKITLFWSKHGGIQRRHDFENRIQEADRLFTSCVDGSRTPMGIVYIVCGVPDYIDCRGDYIENWYYNVGERAYVVQFRRVDEHTGHEYYELSPFSIADSFWLYQIDRWRRKN